MPERPSPTRIANVAFLVFFVLYTAGSVIWLLSGIPPILAGRSLAVHETLHRWGAGDRGYIVVSSDGSLGQQVTASSRWTEGPASAHFAVAARRILDGGKRPAAWDARTIGGELGRTGLPGSVVVGLWVVVCVCVCVCVLLVSRSLDTR